jgi:hypothetical protein
MKLNTMHNETSQQKDKEKEASTQKDQEETINIIIVSSDRFRVTQEMLEVDENTTQRLVKDMEHMELVLEKIPMKSFVGTGEDTWFDSSTTHQQNPNYWHFRQHL